MPLPQRSSASTTASSDAGGGRRGRGRDRARAASRGPRGRTTGCRRSWRSSTASARLVFLLLALVLALAVVLILAPANDDNVIVRNVFDLAETVAGPFKDVFTVDDDAEREKVVNYAPRGRRLPRRRDAGAPSCRRSAAGRSGGHARRGRAGLHGP